MIFDDIFNIPNFPSFPDLGEFFTLPMEGLPGLDWERFLPEMPDFFIPARQLPKIPKVFPINKKFRPGLFEEPPAFLRQILPEEKNYFDPDGGLPIMVAAVAGSILLHGILAYWGYLWGAKGETPIKLQMRRREEALISEAQEALEKIKADENHQPDYLPFITKAETLGGSGYSDADTQGLLQKFEKKFQEYGGRFTKTASPVQRVYQLGQALFWDYLYHYAADYPNQKNFLEHGKGNCAAQTKLWISAFHRLGLQIPEDYGFALQVFKNHVQPVLFHRDEEGKIEWVQNLIDGRKSDRVKASLYHPAIVHAGLLIKKHRNPPLNFQDLLIQRGEEEAGPPGLNHPSTEGYIEDQPIAWPSSTVEYDGDVPEDATLAPPDYGQEPARDSGPISIPDPGLGVSKVLHCKLFSDEPGWFRHYLFDFWIGPNQHPQSQDSIYFRHPSERDRFLSLLNHEERVRFLKTLALGSLRRAERNPSLERVEAFFENPFQQTPQLSEEEFVEIRTFFIHVSKAPGYFEKVFSEQEAKMLWDGFPRLKKFLENAQTLKNNIENYPRKTLIFLNSLSDQQRFDFLNLMSLLPQQPTHIGRSIGIDSFFLGAYPFLWRLLADPRQVAIHSDRVLQTHYQNGPWLEPWYFEFNLEADFTASPSLESPPSVSSPDASLEAGIVISPETMFQLLLLYPNDFDIFPSPLERWDAQISQVFAKRSQEVPYEHRDRLALSIARYFIRKELMKRYPEFSPDIQYLLLSGIIGIHPKVEGFSESIATKFFEESERIFFSEEREFFLPPPMISVVRQIIQRRGLEFLRSHPPKPPKKSQ